MARGPEIIKLGEKTAMTVGVEKKQCGTIMRRLRKGASNWIFFLFSYREVEAAQRCS